MSAPRRILFAPAGSPDIGGGHVLRAIALAQALAARGARCLLAAGPYGAALASRFGAGAVDVLPLSLADGAQALASAVAASAPDVVVLDDYGLDARAVQALGADRPRVAVIDDLANRSHLCALLVDSGYGRSAGDYAALTPIDCRVLAGPAYALLRPGFQGTDLTPPAGAVSRVFVSLGLSDVEAATARVVRRLLALSPEARIDVALAAGAPSLAPLRALAETDPRLALHVDARDVAALMRGADAAVGGGGASTWERCALGLPSLAVIVADNQRRGVRALEADGVLLACDLGEAGFEAAFDGAWRRLQAPELRAALAARGAALCDGRGADRVAEAILQL